MHLSWLRNLYIYLCVPCQEEPARLVCREEGHDLRRGRQSHGCRLPASRQMIIHCYLLNKNILDSMETISGLFTRSMPNAVYK